MFGVPASLCQADKVLWQREAGDPQIVHGDFAGGMGTTKERPSEVLHLENVDGFLRMQPVAGDWCLLEVGLCAGAGGAAHSGAAERDGGGSVRWHARAVGAAARATQAHARHHGSSGR